HTLDDGVIGYQAATVQPPMMAPSASAWLPSIRILPSVLPRIGCARKGSRLTWFSRQKSYPTAIIFMLDGMPLGLLANSLATARSTVLSGMSSSHATVPT